MLPATPAFLMAEIESPPPTMVMPFTAATALATPIVPADPVPVRMQSLRLGAPIQEDIAPSGPRQERDTSPHDRDFVQQPPLIPHSTKGYNITKNFNKCMDCHAWSRYEQTGATKVSITHFKDREGRESANISPRRYFCTSCHVPQVDAKPLVENTFKRAEGLR